MKFPVTSAVGFLLLGLMYLQAECAGSRPQPPRQCGETDEANGKDPDQLPRKATSQPDPSSARGSKASSPRDAWSKWNLRKSAAKSKHSHVSAKGGDAQEPLSGATRDKGNPGSKGTSSNWNNIRAKWQKWNFQTKQA